MKARELNRRSFLTLGGAAGAGWLMGAGVGLLNKPNVRAAGDPAYYGGLKVGMHTYTLRKFEFKDAVRITKELGLKYIGLNPRHLVLNSTPEQIAEAKKHIEGEGLEMMAVGVVGFAKFDPTPRKVFEFAKAAGFKTISTSIERERLDEFDPLVAEYGIKLAIHNHGPSDKWPTPDKLLEAVKDHHENIGACVDCGHYKRAGVEPHDAIRLLGKRVHDAHLKDVDVAEEKGKSVVMGTGVVDVKALLKALLDIGFDGNAAIEYEADAENPAPGVAKSLEHIRKCLGELKTT